MSKQKILARSSDILANIEINIGCLFHLLNLGTSHLTVKFGAFLISDLIIIQDKSIPEFVLRLSSCLIIKFRIFVQLAILIYALFSIQFFKSCIYLKLRFYFISYAFFVLTSPPFAIFSSSINLLTRCLHIHFFSVLISQLLEYIDS